VTRPRVVQVALGDQGERASYGGRQRVDLGRELLEHVGRRLVGERVHGVEPQPVDVVVAQPHQRVVDDPPAYLVGVRVVEVDALSPGRVMPVGEVRSEPVQVVAAGAQVVVYDVEDDTQPPRMAGVDEARETVGAAVRLVDGVDVHAVVAPAVPPGKAATGMTSTRSIPSSTRWSSRSIAASKVPSAVKVPTCSS
jgi:hypothetical protein